MGPAQTLTLFDLQDFEVQFKQLWGGLTAEKKTTAVRLCSDQNRLKGGGGPPADPPTLIHLSDPVIISFPGGNDFHLLKD